MSRDGENIPENILTRRALFNKKILLIDMSIDDWKGVNDKWLGQRESMGHRKNAS